MVVKRVRVLMRGECMFDDLRDENDGCLMGWCGEIGIMSEDTEVSGRVELGSTGSFRGLLNLL